MTVSELSLGMMMLAIPIWLLFAAFKYMMFSLDSGRASAWKVGEELGLFMGRIMIALIFVLVFLGVVEVSSGEYEWMQIVFALFVLWVFVGRIAENFAEWLGRDVCGWKARAA